MDSLKFTSEESSEVLSEFVRPDLHAYTRSSEVLSEFVWPDQLISGQLKLHLPNDKYDRTTTGRVAVPLNWRVSDHLAEEKAPAKSAYRDPRRCLFWPHGITTATPMRHSHGLFALGVYRYTRWSHIAPLMKALLGKGSCYTVDSSRPYSILCAQGSLPKTTGPGWKVGRIQPAFWMIQAWLSGEETLYY